MADRLARLRRLSSQVSRHPLGTAVVLVVGCSGAGYVLAAVTAGTLAETLLVASTTLLFVALLGGVVKLLLEDVQRERERRNEQARFVKAVLDDLKSVYDRVERVRVLVAAHQSALTYGNEMRDLIDATVRLRNVTRALDPATSGFSNQQHVRDVELAVDSMEAYLNALTLEFRERYKPVADKQKIYEAEFKRFLEKPGTEGPPPNLAWEEIKDLPRLAEFRDSKANDNPTTASDEAAEAGEDVIQANYGQDFIGALDLASWILRTELRVLAGQPTQAMPTHLDNTRDRLCERRGFRETAPGKGPPAG